MVKKIILVLTLVLLTFSSVAAAEDDVPFESLADTYVQGGREVLDLIKMKSDGTLFFRVMSRSFEAVALIPYERSVYDFYLNANQTGGYSTLITPMLLPGQMRGMIDDDLGEWQESLHILPIYAAFKVEGGQVICKKPFYSMSGIHASHFRVKIRNIDHTQLIEIFMTHMPRLHEVIQAKGIALP